MARKRQQASPRRRSEKKRYLVFTEGEVTEKQYLELLQQQIRSKIATFKTITVGGEPTKVWKSVEDMLNNNRRGSKDDNQYDAFILIIDVDQHKRLQEVIQKCSSGKSIYAVVSNPCFEQWLLWHKVEKTKHMTTAQCVKESNIEKITTKKHLAHNFPIEKYTIARERAVAAWQQYRVNDIGPNPSSAMPWFIDLLVAPPKKK
jgi:hypothetical protein